MKLYTLLVTMMGQNGSETRSFRDLAEGDLEDMKTAARLNAPTGHTVVLGVFEQN